MNENQFYNSTSKVKLMVETILSNINTSFTLSKGRYRRSPRNITVIWPKPNMGWTKINTNDSIKDNLATGGAIAMDHQGEFLSEFSVNLGSGKVLHVELLFIMITSENAVNRD